MECDIRKRIQVSQWQGPTTFNDLEPQMFCRKDGSTVFRILSDVHRISGYSNHRQNYAGVSKRM